MPSNELKQFRSHGRIVHKDSIKIPLTKKASIPEKIKAGKPTETVFNSNLTNINYVELLSNASEVKPLMVTPGKDTLLLPEINKAVPVIKKCGDPTVTMAKSPMGKDYNPFNFSTYKVLQGLNQQNIRSLIEDRKGNLWLGTRGGGVIRFDGKYFSQYSEKQGLCNAYTWSLLEDKKGNIWMGSQFNGVDMYDGVNFYNYSLDNGLSNKVVYDMFEDTNGDIWFGTENGFNIYDGVSFKHYSIKQGLSSNVIWDIHKDKHGIFWLGTNLGGLIKFDGKQFSIYSKKQGAPFNIVYKIIEDENGDLILGTEYGAYKYQNGKFISLFNNKNETENPVYGLLKDDQNNIWCGTASDGLYKISGDKIAHYSTKEGLGGNQIWNILKDKNNNLWFATGTGLMYYKGDVFSHYSEKEGLSNSGVNGIMQGNDSVLYFATSTGLDVFNGKRFLHFNKQQGLNLENVRCAKLDSKGNIWLGSTGEGVSMYDGEFFYNYTGAKGFGNNIVIRIEETKDGNIWFCTEGSLIKFDGENTTYFGKPNGLSGDIIRCFKEDSKGNLWIGSSNGLTKIGKNETCHFDSKNGLLSDIVFSILIDSKGALWIASPEGVMKYENDVFTYFTVKEGLCNNNAFSCIEDKNGDMWFGTMNGLSKLKRKNLEKRSTDPETPIFENYYYEDGLLGVGCRINSLFQDKAGDIWIGTNDRLTKLHSDFKKQESANLNVNFTGIQLFDQKLNWQGLLSNKDTTILLDNGTLIHDLDLTGITAWNNMPVNLSLAHNNNNITIQYIGISPNQSNKTKYKYKLDPIDENWSALIDRTEVNFGSLMPGNYTFRVKAMDQEGKWSSEATYEFAIRAPWWQTNFFYVSLTVFVIVSLYVFYYVRTSALRKRKIELETLVTERTAEVVHQKIEIEENRKEILDSINYAKRIQYALLASDTLLSSNLPEHFVLFKPKDIVSGDFYWAMQTPEGFSLIVADCTGHGVPGAFMSLLNISKLSQTISENRIYRPDLVLNNVRAEIIKALNPEGTIEQSKDGMDAILCKIDIQNLKLEYAAANNSFYIIRPSNQNDQAKELIICKPDKMPVGAGYGDLAPFTYNEVKLQKGDMVYLLTDGFADQFGGEKGKKFKYKQLEDLFLSISDQTMQHQKQHLDTAFLNWKGALEQVDDVCVIGIKI